MAEKESFQTDISTIGRVGQPTPVPQQEYTGWLKAVEGITKNLDSAARQIANASDKKKGNSDIDPAVYQEVAFIAEQNITPEEVKAIDTLVQTQGQLKGNATQIIIANRVRQLLGDKYAMYEIDKAYNKYQTLNKEHYGEGFSREDELQKQQEALDNQTVTGAVSNGTAVYNPDGTVNRVATLRDQKAARDSMSTLEGLYNDAVVVATKGKLSMRDYDKLSDTDKNQLNAQITTDTLTAYHNITKLGWNKLNSLVLSWDPNEWASTVAILSQSLSAAKMNVYSANAPQAAKDQTIKALEVQEALLESLGKVSTPEMARKNLELQQNMLKTYGLSMSGAIGNTTRMRAMGIPDDIIVMSQGSNVAQEVSEGDVNIPSFEEINAQNVYKSNTLAVTTGAPVSGMTDSETLASFQQTRDINKTAANKGESPEYKQVRTNTTKSLLGTISQVVDPNNTMSNKKKAVLMNAAVDIGNDSTMLDSAKQDLSQKEYTAAMNNLSFIAEDVFIKENMAFMSGMNAEEEMFIYNPTTKQFERGEGDRGWYNPVSWFAESGYSDTLTEMNKAFTALVETRARAMGVNPKTYDPLPIARELLVKTKGGFRVLGDVVDSYSKMQQQVNEDIDSPTATQLAQAFWDETVDSAKKAGKSWDEAKDALKKAWDAELKEGEKMLEERAKQNPKGIEAWILSGAQ